MHHKKVIPVVVVLIVAVSLPASASPLFRIGEGGDRTWQQAIDDGNVRPVVPAPDLRPVESSAGRPAVGASASLTQAAQEFYNTQGVPFSLVPTRLGPADAFVPDGQGMEHQSLVMSWQDSSINNPDHLQIGAWEYVYDVDPDLSGLEMHFSIFAPPGIWDLSVEMIDMNGNSAGWFMSMPPNTWQEYWLDLDNLGNQSGFLYFEGGPFDITQVVALRFDEAGVLSMPLTPPNPYGEEFFWNAWNHVEIRRPISAVPEPATLTLLALGAGALFLRRPVRDRGGQRNR
ncbi:MAG: PEP-CTERM sorting domain-containing protein [Planctomycetales bacterium]|nr:PEP-CTERM sorting domain-containing protein [Planctomycetales bacterium]NIM10213.1 PEP-CTERM sorting domain-containing protein [Planctomycetales bacterium]NIN09629.1 PEP-CTERM sorting domain-containing protein [Planctomycetales bacterium]NIN78755.1 PEP-CTERM sorting domain-containing protein [Planctomycetales bacterium]NIO35930.1 PEP-CTERM sorting domain-containing protein [Planctomycetales bacterium]